MSARAGELSDAEQIPHAHAMAACGERGVSACLRRLH
jgi:hypothetical protein